MVVRDCTITFITASGRVECAAEGERRDGGGGDGKEWTVKA